MVLFNFLTYNAMFELKGMLFTIKADVQHITLWQYIFKEITD